MKGNKTKLLQLLGDNQNEGIILIDNIPYSVHSSGKDIEFTGDVWKWKTTTIPSAHNDYEIETDALVKDTINTKPLFSSEQQYEFYESINDYLKS